MTLQSLLSHPWFDDLLAAVIAAPLALLVHFLGGMLLRRVTRSAPKLQRTLINIQAPSRLVLPLAALQMVWQAGEDNLHMMGTVRHVNGLLLIAATTWLAARAVNGFADGVVAQQPADVTEDLRARSVLTQTRVLARTVNFIVVVAGLAMMLMTFPGARHVGASLLASAGVIGIVAGLAAKPVFSNLLAGMQIALAQPIRIGDVLVVEGEWGRVDEITGTFVVLRIWDDRRLILPLSYFIEKPFQNWTRNSFQLLGAVVIYVDYGMPMDALRAEVERLVKAAPEWDGRFFNVQVTDANDRTIQVRALCTAANAGLTFDLRCRVREGMVAFVQREYPQFLPRTRTEGSGPAPVGPTDARSGDGALSIP
ncbi:MAG: mechanosensitive ion channel family protein [Gammaproteobacteria bacterium]|nr:mechanosensitive ion channel family protein [Gammaproteobacteria bacterium]MBU2287165.1 mechanosensitive ion channel family protein [Gammaproteobacteria bacterium]